MAKIPRTAIKQFVKGNFGLSITANGADAFARILEAEAERISKFAVTNAKRANRGKVTKEDISKYVINKD